MMHVGGYYEYRGGVQFTIVTLMDHLGTVWSIIHVWGLKQLPSQQQIHWHYMGFVWDPFKKWFWAASFLSPLQQTSRVSYGTNLYKCFRAASTLSL